MVTQINLTALLPAITLLTMVSVLVIYVALLPPGLTRSVLASRNTPTPLAR